MKKETSFLICGLLVGCLIATAGFAWYLKNSTSQSGRLVLKLGHTLDTSHPVHKGLEFMKERLEELSGGFVTIDIYPSSVLGSEVECLERLQEGSLAMTKTSALSIENFVPELSVLVYPYLFRDREHFWTVLDGNIGKDLLQEGNDQFIKGLCYYDAGSRNFYTTNKPIRTPDDLTGLNIRVMNSSTAKKMVSYLGASSTAIDFGELYSALQQGIVDGAENNLPSFISSVKHYEVCKHFSLDAHTRAPDILFISTKVWDKLDPTVQGWIAQASEESSHYQRKLWVKAAEDAIALAKAEGVTFYEVDLIPFIEKVQPMYDAITNEKVKSLAKKIREVKP